MPLTSAKPAGLFHRLRAKLAATHKTLGQGLGDLLLGSRAVDANLLDELETLLIGADVGVETTQTLVADLRQRLSRKEIADASAVYRELRQSIRAIVQPASQPLAIPTGVQPYIVLVVGVNGVGKTTTIAKLADLLHRGGHQVMLAAADTFRAAAIEQLKTWSDRIGVTVIAQHTGADAAAVAHDAAAAARARGADVLIVDTAGRQHTSSGLMDELKKIKRVLAKASAGAPHEVLMILDASTGQNALTQLHSFHAAVGVTGLVLTKLDGTAKGGILIAIAKQSGLPIRYIGVGEGLDDLQAFDAEEFVEALFS